MKTLTMVFVTFILLLCFSNHTFSQINFATQLTASQSVPPVAVETSATGTGYFILNEEKTELQFRITVCDLTGPITAAHFHNDRFGKAGGVVRTITNDFNGNTATGIWKSTDGESLTPQLVQALLEGEIYVNIHTAANQPGEIRGQLGSLGFTANLDTAQAIPSPAMPSGASGSGTFTLNPGKSELKFDITVDNLTGPITAAHFHLGEAGTTGSVVKTITGDFVGNTASGYWRSSDSEALTDSLVDELMSDNLYINIHTAANQPGEIRGQVLLDNDIHLSTQLTVNQAVPPVGVTSEGSGTGAFTLDDTMTEVAYSITVTNLTGPIAAAHFHRGAPGATGGVVKTITSDFVGNTAIGKWESTDSEPLTPELVDELLKGNLYINIHTSSNQPGEIR
ncbi:MAG: CHRD domain-containing protein, partial [bacterium]